MKYFYRVQNSKGRGPYISGNFQDRGGWNTTGHHREHGNPGPRADEEISHIDIIDDHIFGFLTLDMLQSWFRPEELKKLQKEGFTIVRVKGIEVASSSYQSVFKAA